MRKVYWYTPFPDLEGDAILMAREGNAYQKENIGKLSAAKVKIYFDCTARNPPLGGIAAGDRLYVIGHGDAMGGMIAADGKSPPLAGFTDFGGKPMLTPDQLVVVMERNGFQWNCRDIRLYCCKAARDLASFAHMFARLVQPKNPDARVFGYTGMLDRTTTPGRGKMAMLDSGGSLVKASVYRREVTYKVPVIPTIEDSDDEDSFEWPDVSKMVWNTTGL